MKANKQDGKASLPSWYRSFLLWLYGAPVVATVDSIGAKHDSDIENAGYLLAALKMVFRLFFCLPWLLIALPISATVIFYAIIPQRLKKIYWKLIS